MRSLSQASSCWAPSSAGALRVEDVFSDRPCPFRLGDDRHDVPARTQPSWSWLKAWRGLRQPPLCPPWSSSSLLTTMVSSRRRRWLGGCKERRQPHTEERYAGIARAVGGETAESTTAARPGKAAISNDGRGGAGPDDDRSAARGRGDRLCARGRRARL